MALRSVRPSTPSRAPSTPAFPASSRLTSPLKTHWSCLFTTILTWKSYQVCSKKLEKSNLSTSLTWAVSAEAKNSSAIGKFALITTRQSMSGKIPFRCTWVGIPIHPRDWWMGLSYWLEGDQLWLIDSRCHSTKTWCSFNLEVTLSFCIGMRKGWLLCPNPFMNMKEVHIAPWSTIGLIDWLMNSVPKKNPFKRAAAKNKSEIFSLKSKIWRELPHPPPDGLGDWGGLIPVDNSFVVSGGRVRSHQSANEPLSTDGH